MIDAALESEIAALKARIRELEAGPGTFSSAVRHALRLANDATGWPPLTEQAARKRSKWILDDPPRAGRARRTA